MATDASSSGWGGSLQALSASGRWSRGQRSRHINSLELMAVENSLRSFQDRLEGRTVCVHINNRTALAYLAREGGTKSVLLSRLACRILLSQRHRITLIPVYVSGIGNTIADALSRGKETQWHLSPMMVNRIFQRYGTPQVDLFASRETAQLPQYMDSPGRGGGERQSSRVDQEPRRHGDLARRVEQEFRQDWHPRSVAPTRCCQQHSGLGAPELVGHRRDKRRRGEGRSPTSD